MTDTYLTGQNGRRVQLARVKVGGWTQARRKLFLETLAATCNVTAATAAAGMKGKTAYELRKRDPAFAALWQEALEMGYETLERALLRGALEGVNAIEIGAPDETARTGAIDDDYPGAKPAADRQAGHAAPGSGVPRVPASMAQLQFGLSLLNRQRGGVEGSRQARGRSATRAEVDALLRTKLDSLARRMATRT